MKELQDKNNVDVTIVIPTKNGGILLKKVLDSIFSQKTTYTYEVICVDSGSLDHTLSLLEQYDIRLFQIPAVDFGHGKTRNFGASKGTGTYIVFLTQDALPASVHWLQNMIDAMQMEEGIAGGFGIHYPYPDCNLIDKRDITAHFQGFGEDNTIYYLEDWDRYRTQEGYRHLLAYFSDNNACLKREVWEKYPYEDVDFAEDQIWMRRMMELGYKKVYCPHAPVYHSHNYRLSSYFGRYFDEYRSLYGLHGYRIVNKWWLVLPGAVLCMLSDLRYLVRLQDIGWKEKIFWQCYSIRRNLCRFIAGYLGGRYHAYPARVQGWLDRHVSQQYRQRRG
ncbi:MAG: glycosyltransferase family 2 protein [Eubacterium sp.]|nr:glycosyltransferase family 2 protein [Eubacterium sp.]